MGRIFSLSRFLLVVSDLVIRDDLELDDIFYKAFISFFAIFDIGACQKH